MKKITVKEALASGDMELRNEGIVYAKYVLNYTNRMIADLAGLAIGTIRNYCDKFYDLLEKAKKRFDEFCEEVFHPVEERISYSKGVSINGECAYIIGYYSDIDRKNLVFTKIGKTKHISQRIKEHLRAYEKEYGTLYATVHRLYYFNNSDDALSAENGLRKHYKSIPDSGYIAQDRFAFVPFNEKEIDSDEKLTGFISFLCPSAIY